MDSDHNKLLILEIINDLAKLACVDKDSLIITNLLKEMEIIYKKFNLKLNQG